jgi:hypothetical protein
MLPSLEPAAADSGASDGSLAEGLDFVALCYEFPPWLLAGAIWTEKLLIGLRDRGWRFEVITAAPGGSLRGIPVHHVQNIGGPAWLSLLNRAKLSKLLEWVVWPDDAIYWNDSAVRFTRDLILAKKPRMIVNFMMPYGAGMAGERLKAITGLPLVYCFSDSQSCTDMNPYFPSWFHYRRARRLEDGYIRAADAVVYVSRFNADLVRSRQPLDQHEKFNVVRFGAEADEFAPVCGHCPDPDGPVRIVYLGGMGGWHKWYKRRPALSSLKRMFDAIGRYTVTPLDYRTQSPVFIGRAIQQVLASRPDWQGKVFVDVYGGRCATEEHIRKVLDVTGLDQIVRVHGMQSRSEVSRLARTADVLFHCVPNRTDNTPGGRIGAKTYEYLMTDRPILAAVPKGENWDYYAGKPGVWLVAPDEVAAMAKAITEVCAAKIDRHQPLAFDRGAFRDDLSYAHRAEELAAVLHRIATFSGTPATGPQ